MRRSDINDPDHQRLRVVRLFERFASELHVDTLREAARLTHLAERQFYRVMTGAALDGVEVGLRIVPVIERPGWWSGYPSRRIAARAELAAIQRQKGEAQNKARIYFDFGSITEWMQNDAKNQEYREAAFVAANPELNIGPEFDYVLGQIDAASTDGRGYVLLNGR